MGDQHALLEEFVLERLRKAPGTKITAKGYEDLKKAFGVPKTVSVTKFRQTLGRLGSKDPKKLFVSYSERQGVSDIEPRSITVTLLRSR